MSDKIIVIIKNRNPIKNHGPSFLSVSNCIYLYSGNTLWDPQILGAATGKKKPRVSKRGLGVICLSFSGSSQQIPVLREFTL